VIKADDGFKDREENRKAATASKDKQRRVLKVVEEGLLQVHQTAPNTKQQEIFWIMGKTCDGFNNRIGRNKKIAKALDIKEDLKIDCLMCCKHRINF
jgi:hypothetical protein